MKYKALSNLNHDGKEYVKGDKIEMDKDQAKVLVADGVLKGVKDKSVQVPVTGEEEEEKVEIKAKKETEKADKGKKGKGKSKK